jgi:hypothetical protein
MNRTFRNGSAIVCPSKHKFRMRKLRGVCNCVMYSYLTTVSVSS